MKWFPLCNFTHYSLQRGFSKPNELVKKCKENSYPACGIADYKSLSGVVAFYKACVDNDIKPIIGCSFDNFKLFCKNKNGWLNLIELVSSIDDDGNLDEKHLLRICSLGNLICIVDKECASPVSPKDTYIQTDLFPESYYCDKDQAELHRIILCSSMKLTLPKVKKKILNDETFKNQIFFESNDFYLKSKIESSKLMVDNGGVDVFVDIFNKCENYNILSRPRLPKFETPDGMSQTDYLIQLARQGWKNLLADKIVEEDKKKEYGDRFRSELEIIKEADLAGYFLIVRDIIQFIKGNGWMAPVGRGSVGGCLIAFLLEITEVDPIEYDLLMSRFYNPGRNTKDYVSLPDIDIDVPAAKRDDIIEYLRGVYGKENVSQMCTFGRLQGRSAIKEVLRVHEACGFSEMNQITKSIPDEAAISDQLSQMDDEDRSIIRWALINNQEDLMDYCHINDNGMLEGDYAEMFQQAIDIEGTFKSQGKHAAGVVISAEPLHTVCPMMPQKSGTEKIAGLEMADLEALGHVKFDLLGLLLLDRLMKIKELNQQ